MQTMASLMLVLGKLPMTERGEILQLCLLTGQFVETSDLASTAPSTGLSHLIVDEPVEKETYTDTSWSIKLPYQVSVTEDPRISLGPLAIVSSKLGKDGIKSLLHGIAVVERTETGTVLSGFSKYLWLGAGTPSLEMFVLPEDPATWPPLLIGGFDELAQDSRKLTEFTNPLLNWQNHMESLAPTEEALVRFAKAFTILHVGGLCILQDLLRLWSEGRLYTASILIRPALERLFRISYLGKYPEHLPGFLDGSYRHFPPLADIAKDIAPWIDQDDAAKSFGLLHNLLHGSIETEDLLLHETPEGTWSYSNVTQHSLDDFRSIGNTIRLLIWMYDQDVRYRLGLFAIDFPKGVNPPPKAP